jgi:hypothetical protein
MHDEPTVRDVDYPALGIVRARNDVAADSLEVETVAATPSRRGDPTRFTVDRLPDPAAVRVTMDGQDSRAGGLAGPTRSRSKPSSVSTCFGSPSGITGRSRRGAGRAPPRRRSVRPPCPARHDPRRWARPRVERLARVALRRAAARAEGADSAVRRVARREGSPALPHRPRDRLAIVRTARTGRFLADRRPRGSDGSMKRSRRRGRSCPGPPIEHPRRFRDGKGKRGPGLCTQDGLPRCRRDRGSPSSECARPAVPGTATRSRLELELAPWR